MAVVRPGPLVADIRGSVGDTTWSRNKGGLYVKARVTSTNPDTAPQQYSRNALTIIAQTWSATLTEDQRSSWRAYAHAWPQPNTWGNPTRTTGYTRYVQANMQYTRERAQTIHPALPVAADVLYKDAPPSGPLPIPAMLLGAMTAPDLVFMSVPPITHPDPQPGLRLYVYQSDQVAPGRSYPIRDRTYIDHNHNLPPWDHDPWLWNSPYALDTAQRLWAWTVAQLHPTGEISTWHLSTCIIDNPTRRVEWIIAWARDHGPN